MPYQDDNIIRLKRKGAIFIGFNVLFIMTMLIAINAMSGRSPEQQLYTELSIAGCFWMAIAIVLAVHYSTKVWPWVLICATSVVYIATAATLVFGDRVIFAHQGWMIGFYWVCVGIVVAGGAVEIVRRDFRKSRSDKRGHEHVGESR